MLTSKSPRAKDLFAAADYLSPDLNDKAMLERSLSKLFKQAFDIDINTCTEGEWAERITIKGGTLKQWRSFTGITKPATKTKVIQMSSTKSLTIFIALSVVLLIGIGFLPKH